MQYIVGINRTQSILFPESLDQIIDQNNEVRMIDLFVDSINPLDFKFIMKTSMEGRPSYDPKDLLKLFVYGYLNQIRSSRALEKECKRNIELMWLMKQLAPDHNTISNFRRDNEKAIRRVFRYTVSIAKQFDLIGGKLIAGDSTKLRAQNSKKNNFNARKIERHLAYIDNKLAEYNAALELAEQENKIVIQKQIQKQNERKNKYHAFTADLEATGQVQISTSDPDSRQLITRNNITEVAYNVQTVVDAKHNLPIDYKVTNENDSKAMGGMLRRTKTILNTTDFTALYDKGYHTGSEIKTAVELGIHIMEQNQNNIDTNPKLYKKRQAIVEHPYGILKRQWGFYYILTKKGKKRASADVGLMFVAYNLRRMMNILDKNIFKKFLKELGFLFFEKVTPANKNAFTKAIPVFELPKLNLFLRAA